MNDQSKLTVAAGNIFRYNEAQTSGVISISTGTTSITESDFLNNNGSNGAGVIVAKLCVLTLSKCNIKNNTALKNQI